MGYSTSLLILGDESADSHAKIEWNCSSFPKDQELKIELKMQNFPNSAYLGNDIPARLREESVPHHVMHWISAKLAISPEFNGHFVRNPLVEGHGNWGEHECDATINLPPTLSVSVVESKIESLYTELKALLKGKSLPKALDAIHTATEEILSTIPPRPQRKPGTPQLC